MKTKIILSKKEAKVVVKYPKMGGLYQHYKGGTYIVHTLAKHSETDEDMVVYQNVERSSMHVRPLSMWFEIIPKVEKRFKVPRFELIKE